MIARLDTRPRLSIAAPTSASIRARTGPSRLIVGIVAAYPSLRAGLATLIQDDLDLTASAIAPEALGSGTRVPTVNQITDADVILIEPNDLEHDALTNLVTVANADSVPLIWLGRPAGDLVRAVAGRAGGVIAQNAESETLIAAIRAAAAGLFVQDPTHLTEGVHGDGSSSQASFPGAEGFLSPREREVLALVASGLPNKAIARELGISDHTVKFHVSSLLTKLGAGSRTEAVTVATRMGVLSLQLSVAAE